MSDTSSAVDCIERVVAWRNSIEKVLSDWQTIQSRMARFHHPDFTRSEWAYLLGFCSPSRLRSVLEESLLSNYSVRSGRVLLRPPQRVALWLPNNVSLLGPLTLILLSLTGCTVRAKAGSQGRDCCKAFLSWLLENCSIGALRNWLEKDVQVNVFSRSDTQNLEMAGWAQFRIFFGSDGGAAAIEKLPHPTNSRGFYFSHRTSEAWVEPAMIGEQYAIEFARVFGLYGRAGCTSPLRVVVINGCQSDATRLAELLSRVWPTVNPIDVPRNVASQHVLSMQLARAAEKTVVQFPRNAGFATVEPAGTVALGGLMAISVQWGTLQQTLNTQCSVLQTIGFSASHGVPESWHQGFRDGNAARFVSLRRMHEFGSIWDGIAWFRQLFSENMLEI